jgi:hypothetical protein
MQITKSDISRLIKIQKADTFWNHFIYSMTFNHRTNGEIENSFIKIWQKRNSKGAFYPVFTFEFDNQNRLIKITDRLNSYGRIIQLIFPFIFFLPLIYTSIIDFELNQFLIGGTIILILFLSILLLNNKIYQFEKKENLKEFCKTLNITIKEKEPEKEWSIKMIFIRLFIYPFCFVLIFASIFLLIPEGKFNIAIPTLGIVGVYFYSDLKMIFK